MRSRRLSSLAFALTFVACGGAPSPAAHTEAKRASIAPSASASVAPSTAAPKLDGEAIFKDLVARIRADHVFAKLEDFGHPFDEELPALERAFAAAKTPEDLMAALNHLENALRDGHCRYRAPSPAGKSARLTLGFTAAARRDGASISFVVGGAFGPAAKESLHAGDQIVALDGVAAADFLETYRLETNALHRDAAAIDIASFLTQRSSTLAAVRAGDDANLRVRDAAGSTRDVKLTWLPSGTFDGHGPSLDDAFDANELSCDGVPRLQGVDYALVAVGANVCVYTSKTEPYARFPLVRQNSFAYDGAQEHGGPNGRRLAHVDHEFVARTLREAGKKIDGVILDVRNNGGGNNPYVFLDWWARAPYERMIVHTKLVPTLRDQRALEETLYGADRAKAYLAALDRGETGFMRAPFECTGADCANAAHSAPTQRVIDKPVALVVGPWCRSSCDAFAATFERFHLGPLVGAEPASAFTVNRLPIHLTAGDVDLGTFLVALSYSSWGDDVPLEGVPRALDAPIDPLGPPDDKQAIDLAIRALGAAAPAPQK